MVYTRKNVAAGATDALATFMGSMDALGVPDRTRAALLGVSWPSFLRYRAGKAPDHAVPVFNLLYWATRLPKMDEQTKARIRAGAESTTVVLQVMQEWLHAGGN